jgi:hypothetical protein
VPNLANNENPYNLTAQQQADFATFIKNDTYLNSRQGKYTERNAARTPWNNQLDLRLMHDFNLKVGQKTNTLQISFDIINFSNMLSKTWGVYYFTPNTINSSVDPGLTIGNGASRGITFANGANGPTGNVTISGYNTPTSKYSIDQFSSRWQAQVGVRYTF